jgi:hypothetical protein
VKPDDGADEASPAFARELWSTKAEPVAPQPSALHLEEVLKRLHDSEINAGIQTFFDGGLRAWIGDPLNGRVASAAVSRDDVAWGIDGSIARWLHEAALALYPDSHYAKAHRGQ